MKISKLFHWLYAILMMLPVFFIGGRMIYVTFNKNAKDSWSGQNQININYKYETNEVNSVDDLIEGNIYKFAYDEDFSLVGRVGIETLVYDESMFVNYNAQPVSVTYDTTIRTNYRLSENQFYKLIAFTKFNNGTNMYSTTYNDLYFIYGNTQYNQNLIDLIPLISASDYMPIINVDIIQDTLDNAFEYSLNEINTNPLFAWAKDSFLVTPFRYITNLFGMPSDSPINTLLSYWLDISIIYLVFDVVMYLPLLAHRWIDKGMIE